jgi:hypothetical protein
MAVYQGIPAEREAEVQRGSDGGTELWPRQTVGRIVRHGATCDRRH